MDLNPIMGPNVKIFGNYFGGVSPQKWVLVLKCLETSFGGSHPKMDLGVKMLGNHFFGGLTPKWTAVFEQHFWGSCPKWVQVLKYLGTTFVGLTPKLALVLKYLGTTFFGGRVAPQNRSWC